MPSTSDKRYFNVGPELVKVLHITSVDAQVAALLSSSNIPGEPEDRLRPNDRRADHCRGLIKGMPGPSTHLPPRHFLKEPLSSGCSIFKRMSQRLISNCTRTSIKLWLRCSSLLMLPCTQPISWPRPWPLLWRPGVSSG